MKKVLVISGASKGIGLATATLFQQHGYQVVNLSRSAIPLAGATHISADFSDRHWGDHCAEGIISALTDAEQVVLVHNAALMHKGSGVDLDIAELEASLAVNILAPAILNKIVVPHMLKGSALLYIGSTLAEKAVPNTAPYVISKHAVVGFMRSSCQDLAGRGIHSACICPGFTGTEMLLTHAAGDQGFVDAIADTVTFGRLIEPAEIAQTVYFCATSPVINGAVIHANLGQIER